MRALVVEGGGMRAAYASGAVAGLASRGLTVDAAYGTSAGGAICAWFAAGQADDGTRTWSYAKDPTTMSWRRWFQGGDLIDQRRLIDGIYVNEIPLAIDRVRSAPFPTWVTVADVETAETRYFDLRRGSTLELIKATGALPLAIRDPIFLLPDGSACPHDAQTRRRNHGDCRGYLDGGVTEPIPLARAIADGATDIVCVFNRPQGLRRAEPAIVARMVGRRYPALEGPTRRHHILHNEAVALAERPAPGVRVTIVRPSHDVGVGRLTRDLGRIGRALQWGRRDGERAVVPGLRQHVTVGDAHVP
ncbi:MAG: patatin-like phospholipase family protein [Thermoplasmatota archaeon]